MKAHANAATLLALMTTTVVAQYPHWATHPITQPNASFGAFDTCATDLDADGDIDVIACGPADLSCHINDGTGFGFTHFALSTHGNYKSACAADLDADGDLDILVAVENHNGSDRIGWFERLNNSISFAPLQTISTVVNAPWRAHAADIDGDGDVDVLSASQIDNKIAAYFNQGNGAFGMQQVLSTSSTWTRYVTTADLDGDGDLDILAGEAAYGVTIFENLTSGSFSSKIGLNFAGNGAYRFVVGDINGDGMPDIAGVSPPWRAWASNLGNLNFAIATAFGYSCATSLAAGDFDQDGDVDMIAGCNTGDRLEFIENAGGGNLLNPATLAINVASPDNLTTADMDGDGDLDVICSDCTVNEVFWFENTLPVPHPSSAISYGTGCGTPPLTAAPTTNPIIGTTATVGITNAPTAFGGISLGTSNTYTFPIALPFELSTAGMPGCYLLQSNEVTGLPLSPTAAPSTLQFSASLPFNTALLGQQFYIQAYVVAPGANATQVITSNGIEWTIGNQ